MVQDAVARGDLRKLALVVLAALLSIVGVLFALSVQSHRISALEEHHYHPPSNASG